MYEIVKRVIESKNYDLSSMLKKLDTLWVQGDITEDQRIKMISLAQANANAQNGIDVLAKLEEMDRRLIAIEKQLQESSDTETGEGEEGTETMVPEYVAGKWYYAGDEVTFDGLIYVCIAPEGQVCTWNPVEYPPYWELKQ